MQEESQSIEAILDRLLATIIVHDDASSNEITSDARLIWFGSEADHAPGQDQLRALRAKGRRLVRQCGEELFGVLGSTGAMAEVAERVAAMDPVQYGRRASIIDHAWSGIGTASDGWAV